jgi:hypothetical protein
MTKDQHHHKCRTEADQVDILDVAAVIPDEHREQREGGTPPRDRAGPREGAMPTPVG